MGKRMVLMGAGAVGGYLGGHLARNGKQVILVNPSSEQRKLSRTFWDTPAGGELKGLVHIFK